MNKKIVVVPVVAVLALSAFSGLSYAFSGNTSSGKLLNRGGFGSGNVMRQELTEEQKLQMEEVKTLLDKQKSGETLTTDEQAKLTEMKTNMSFGMNRGKGMKMGKQRGGFGMGMKQGFLLTDEEKASFEAMTDEEKQTFVQAKMEELKAKSELREVVVDKLFNLQPLSVEENSVRLEMVKERTERKARFETKKVAE